jgi:DNA recombination protein RmuC
MAGLYVLLGIAVGSGAVWFATRARVDALRDAAERERASAAEKGALLEEAKQNLNASFAAASAQALQQNNSAFIELAQRELQPLRESLAKVDRQAQQLEHMRGALTQQLTTVAAGQEKLRAETGNLVTALRAPHVRGRWGETQLRTVLEVAGMMEHCDFVMQSSERDSDGNLLRPDAVIRLPGGKQVVIDAKAPLAAYLEGLRDDLGGDARLAHMRDHARQLRDKVNQLSAKRYWAQFEASPDFVILFLPDESFLRAALEHDGALNEDAWRASVILASPSTTLTLLRSISIAWQQETVAESAREVNRLGRELYERLGTFAGHLRGVGNALNSAVGAYNKAVGSLETRVLVTARKFPEHGVGGDEPPDLQPIEQQARQVQAIELVPAGEQVELPSAVDAA